ncbi:MAG: dienelactone hydrolase family protein [Vicinamibacterales bacterium]|jgi:carboxymethylenebutenolidase|nr:carboxymethylenebutenolidase [Acidobacteriota bacterium]MDP6373828.1 dienelactone hydrolase family protein [Vicinamibacterales bacterium]MDP6607786.1 dienelactone hydrolase family protein [Vicinamibacterales bacterium]HAK55130.1 carboxymethylenebutenolidase [Acidobacteriota bacterium]|tara:strand:+ start:9281 stop:10168 length:888 start_codon:yes stop_codon:yes gene_type:complete
MPRKTITDFDPELLSLFDRYVHGFLTRRQFFDRAAKFAVGGVTVAALVDSLGPDYALAQQVAADDARLSAAHVEYPSPQGAGTMRGYLVRPTQVAGPVSGVVVIHENRGLNPYVEDVARRVGTAGFVAFAPDALFPLGGYPGNDDDGRALQRERDRDEMIEDFVAAVGFLRGHESCNGTVGAVGFCFGGSMANTLAVRVPDLAAAVPFYGGQPDVMDVPRIQASLLIHYAGLDERVNAGWPAYEAALQANGKTYTAHMYEGAAHGFHNDTTPRFDEAAAALAWDRTIEFFNQTLR